MQRASDRWKNQQRDGIKNKNSAERYRHFLFVGLKNRADGGDGAPAANCRAGGYQKRGIAAYLQNSSEPKTGKKREGNSQRGVNKSAAARLQFFMQIPPATQFYPRSLHDPPPK